jgi:hypothetical protein
VEPLRAPASVFPFLCLLWVLGPFADQAARGVALDAAPALAELWVNPIDLAHQNLAAGRWADRAPSPTDRYTFLKWKTHGSSPGLTVRDSHGRVWSVKQGREAQPEVFMSRLLSAIGYRQPPVYFLPTFSIAEGSRMRTIEGGRFRLADPALTERGEWVWEKNPYVGTKPYQGLLVILVLMNSADLKNSNNSIYDVASPRDNTHRWYVVRDLGISLGATNRFNPGPDKPEKFEQKRFVTGIRNGFVEFADYDAVHSDLVDRRITPADVQWASQLLARLSERQWTDAFVGAGYTPDLASRYIRRIQQKIGEGRALAHMAQSPFSIGPVRP